MYLYACVLLNISDELCRPNDLFVFNIVCSFVIWWHFVIVTMAFSFFMNANNTNNNYSNKNAWLYLLLYSLKKWLTLQCCGYEKLLWKPLHVVLVFNVKLSVAKVVVILIFKAFSLNQIKLKTYYTLIRSQQNQSL